MGKVVARRRGGPAQTDEQAAVEPQTVADIVEPNGVDQLRIEQGDHMTPRRIGPRLGVHARLPRELAHEEGWNEIANLVQNAELAFAWAGGRLGLGILFHPLLVEPFRLRTKHFLLQPVLRFCFFTLSLASLLQVQAAAADQPPFQYGKEPIYVPNEMPPVERTWHPTNKLNDPGIKRGAPFEAGLIRVFNEDTNFSKEIAVFRLPDGAVRAWKSDSFSKDDLAIIREMKKREPAAPDDARIWTTDLSASENKQLQGGDVSTYETPHFIFVYGHDHAGKGNVVFTDPQFLKRAGDWFEYVWGYYAGDYHAPMPHDGEPEPKRIVVQLYGTGVPGLAENWANSAESMALQSTAMFYGSTVVPHEFCHVIQFYTKGFRDRSSVGAWWETHAEMGAFNFAPTYDADFPVMFKNLDKGYQWTESRYSNWPILMQLWEKKRTHDLVFGVWTQNFRGSHGESLEDPIETTVRLGLASGALPKGWESFNDEIGEMAARMVTMDFINQGYLQDATSDLRREAFSSPRRRDHDGDWYDSPSNALYPYGYHWIRLSPQNGAADIKIKFQGQSTALNAEWRLTLVGVDDKERARYSPTVTALGNADAEASISVHPNEKYVLAVAATPTTYQSLNWGQIPGNTYPYKVEASGADWKSGAP